MVGTRAGEARREEVRQTRVVSLTPRCWGPTPTRTQRGAQLGDGLQVLLLGGGRRWKQCVLLASWTARGMNGLLQY